MEHQCMIHLVDVLTIALATWRLTKMIQRDWGPALVFERLRIAAGCRRAGPGAWQTPMPGSLADLVLCMACCSFWMGLVVFGLWYLSPLCIVPFWASGAAEIIEDLKDGLRSMSTTTHNGDSDVQ